MLLCCWQCYFVFDNVTLLLTMLLCCWKCYFVVEKCWKYFFKNSWCLILNKVHYCHPHPSSTWIDTFLTLIGGILFLTMVVGSFLTNVYLPTRTALTAPSAATNIGTACIKQFHFKISGWVLIGYDSWVLNEFLQSIHVVTTKNVNMYNSYFMIWI